MLIVGVVWVHGDPIPAWTALTEERDQERRLMALVRICQNDVEKQPVRVNLRQPTMKL